MDIKTLRARVLGLAQTVNTSAEGSANYIRYKPLYEKAKLDLAKLEGAKICIKCHTLPEKWPLNPNDPELCYPCHNAVKWPTVYLYPDKILLPPHYTLFVTAQMLVDLYNLDLKRCHIVAMKHRKYKHGRDVDAHIGVGEDHRKPIKLKIYCPRCDMMHIDVGDWATKPHHKHLCEDCGHTWAPFPFNTVGIQ